MKPSETTRRAIALFLAIAAAAFDVAAGSDLASQFLNRGSVLNTRHNLTQSTMQDGQGAVMNPYRNNYGQVCVYCHTPHGANSAPGAPLWNRTLPAGSTFTTYSSLNSPSLTQTVTAPGANSLVCLSCHDGSTAIDAILNMPGSGLYSSAPNSAFLNTWTGPKGPNHQRLGDELPSAPVSGFSTCLVCHQPGESGDMSATDFTVFVIGKDLRNDHPVGVVFPAGNSDFNPTNGTQNGAKFFDANSNNRMDTNEVRIYDGGAGYEVECGSCHDPHGIPSAGAGSQFLPSFLRVASAGSQICLTCHAK